MKNSRAQKTTKELNNYQPGELKDWTDLLHSSVDGAGLRD